MVGICRLCAALRKADALITITDASHEVCHKLRQCCQVEIRLEDALPKCVCCDCVQALRQAHSFYSKVHESQESLSLVFKPVIQSSDVSTAFGPPPTLAESLTSVISKPEFEMVSETDAALEVSEAEKISEESQASTMEENDEDETNLVLENQDEVIDDEVYLIEQLLGRRLDGFDKEIKEDTVKISESLNLNNNHEVVGQSMETLTQTTAAEVEEVLVLKTESQNIAEESDEPAQPVGMPDHANTQETWNNYPWRCYLCDAEEPSFDDLVLHCQVSHDRHSFNDMQFKCVDCQKICTRYYNLINHVRHHHRSSLTLCCDVCNIFCSDFKELAQHRIEHHANELDFPQMLLCGECGHGFWTQNSLQIHSRMHSKRDKNYECSDCGKKFVYFSGWKIHQRVHQDIREFSCEQCGKSFRQKVNLETHMLTHIVEKPYQCTKCQKSFKTPTSLSKHNIIHTDIKKFQCDYCGNKFRSKDAKLSHERTHTGEMPYKCPHCTRSFRFRSTFLSHQNTHTGKRPYSCMPCNHHFSNWPNYNKHMKRRHADDKTDVSSTTDGKKRLKKNACKKSVDDSELLFVYDEILVEETADSPEATVMDEDVVYAITTESLDSQDIEATGII